MSARTVTVDELLEVYIKKNHCRDITQARTGLQRIAEEMFYKGNAETKQNGEQLLLRLQEWDEQKKQQQANTPPPKQKPYAPPPQQTNKQNQAPPQANTAQVYPDGYNVWEAITELLFPVSKLAIGLILLYIVGGVVVNAIKGFGDGVRYSVEKGTPYAIGALLLGVALIGLYEALRKKEAPTENGPTGIIVNHHYYGNGTVKTEQQNAHT